MDVSAKTVRWLAAVLLTCVIATAGAPDYVFAGTLLQGSAKDHPCSQAVREKLVELGIDPDAIKGVSIYRREVRRRVNNRLRRELKGYKAWVVPLDGKGNLVMDLFLNCRVQRVYTSGGFTLPGADGDDQ
jgi:hypothetical protein